MIQLGDLSQQVFSEICLLFAQITLECAPSVADKS